MLDPRTISVVAWDLDNTLFDRDAAARRFFRWYLDQLLGSAGQTRLEAIMALDNGGDGDRLAFCREAMDLISGQPERGGELWNTFRTRLPDFVQPDEAVIDCLRLLRGHYRLALISNGGGVLQRAKLQRAGVADCFCPEDVFISGEVGFEKPDARFFEAALRALRKSPGEVLYVGDHPVNDVVGAAAVGMRTCWVSRGRPQPPGLYADAVVERAAEVAALLLAA